MPEAYRPKVRGDPRRHRHLRLAPARRPAERRIGNLRLGEDERLVTYVSRGLEMMRGFDVFMKAGEADLRRRPDVRFVVVGADRVAYGGDLRHTGGTSFKEHVLAQDDYDLDRIHFVGNVAARSSLAQLLSLSDLHFYLTVPFVLSWSCLNAMACGATMLCSDTTPVREVISRRRERLLWRLLRRRRLRGAGARGPRRPRRTHRERLGAAAAETVAERYALDVTFPRDGRLLRGRRRGLTRR